MNLPFPNDGARNDAGAGADTIADLRARGRSIARLSTDQTLTPSQLGDRATIYPSGEARPEVSAFRELRTKLLAMLEGNFVTMVVPVSRGCGGSFVARNLGAAFAFDHSKTALLIDCDLRHPSQDAIMRIDTSAGGLTDFLENPEAELTDVLYDTGVPRLRLLPAGRPREIGAEYFSSFRMRLMVDSLRSRYPDRYIVLDAPPISGSPDARILADLADVVVLVAGYGRDTAATIAQAAANFDPAKFAGVLFNEGV
jgi:Mrp family chromosome partitioning ATPase